jgi:hypothetical protein
MIQWHNLHGLIVLFSSARSSTTKQIEKPQHMLIHPRIKPRSLNAEGFGKSGELTREERTEEVAEASSWFRWGSYMTGPNSPRQTRMHASRSDPRIELSWQRWKGRGRPAMSWQGEGPVATSISHTRVGQGRVQPHTRPPAWTGVPLLNGAPWDCTSSRWERDQGAEAPAEEGLRRERPVTPAS